MEPTVDAHQHYWQVQRFDYDWPGQGMPAIDRDYLPDDFEPQLRSAGIDQSILVQVLHLAEETEWMLDLAARHPTIAGVVGWADLTLEQEAVQREVESLRRDPGLVGIRHLVHEEPDDDWLLRDDVQRGLAVLEECDVPFDLLLRPQHLPRLRMVIDHIAKPHIRNHLMEPWASGLKGAAENPNVWCKLSGMITEASRATWTADDLAPYVHATLEAFGLDRVMYGSDWPVCTLAGSYEQVIGALRQVLGEIDPIAEAAIFGGAALKFYRPAKLGGH